MTIEALLESIDAKLGVLITQRGVDPSSGNASVQTAAAAPAATTDAPRRGRGRPPKGETPVPAAVAAAEVDPFDAPAAPAKPPEKADVRAALEEYRGRLKAAKVKEGVPDAEAQNFATQRVLAWLNAEFGTTTLAGLDEKDYAACIQKTKTAK